MVFFFSFFCGGKKTGEPGEKTSEQGREPKQTQPTCGSHGGRRALSPLRGTPSLFPRYIQDICPIKHAKYASERTALIFDYC